MCVCARVRVCVCGWVAVFHLMNNVIGITVLANTAFTEFCNDDGL